jgi:hypothetical protein
MHRENVILTTRDITKASTDRWEVSPTMQPDRFLISQRAGGLPIRRADTVPF